MKISVCEESLEKGRKRKHEEDVTSPHREKRRWLEEIEEKMVALGEEKIQFLDNKYKLEMEMWEVERKQRKERWELERKERRERWELERKQRRERWRRWAAERRQRRGRWEQGKRERERRTVQGDRRLHMLLQTMDIQQKLLTNAAAFTSHEK